MKKIVMLFCLVFISIFSVACSSAYSPKAQLEKLGVKDGVYREDGRSKSILLKIVSVTPVTKNGYDKKFSMLAIPLNSTKTDFSDSDKNVKVWSWYNVYDSSVSTRFEDEVKPNTNMQEWFSKNYPMFTSAHSHVNNATGMVIVSVRYVFDLKKMTLVKDLSSATKEKK